MSMGLPTTFSVSMVSELFFSKIRELSVRSLKELKDGNNRSELRLIVRVDKGANRDSPDCAFRHWRNCGVKLPLLRSFGSFHDSFSSFSELQSTSRLSRLVRA